MAIGSFADDGAGNIERETIVLSRALLELGEIHLNYGDDPDNPAPYSVKSKDGEHLFNADPSISALVTVVDDYGDGTYDGRKFWDKFYLKKRPNSDVWEAGENSKLGMVIKTIPKYGPKHFQNPEPFDEDDLDEHRFESATEQREDRSGKKLEGTRLAWKSIGIVPNRTKKRKARKEAEEKIDQEVDDQLSEAEISAEDQKLIDETWNKLKESDDDSDEHKKAS